MSGWDKHFQNFEFKIENLPFTCFKLILLLELKPNRVYNEDKIIFLHSIVYNGKIMEISTKYIFMNIGYNALFYSSNCEYTFLVSIFIKVFLAIKLQK